MNSWPMVFLVLLALIILSFCWPLLVIVLAAFLAFKIYEAAYFRSLKFKTLKDSVTQYVADCNALNEHIHELEATEVPGSTRQGSGTARFTDVSRWNYQRAKLKAQTDATNVYSCSRTVCANARKDPMKYVCKYLSVCLPTGLSTLRRLLTVRMGSPLAQQPECLLRPAKRRCRRFK